MRKQICTSDSKLNVNGWEAKPHKQWQDFLVLNFKTSMIKQRFLCLVV